MKFVGIDVGHKELVAVVRVKGKNQKPKRFGNDSEGHVRLVEWLRKKGAPLQICMEATGIYHFDAAVALSQAEGLELMVINPKAARRFGEALMTRTKTDPVDAGVLAEFAERMDFEPWQCPGDHMLKLRAFSRRIGALTKLKTQTKNQLHAARGCAFTPESIVEQMRAMLTELQTQIGALQAEARTLIDGDPQLAERFGLIHSVRGIGELSAIQLMGELLVLPEDMSARQWVAFAGLDPRLTQSGTSVAKKPRISKAGNRYLRLALYMPALVAVNHEPHVRAYYQHLIQDQGLKKLQALCAVMRKLLHALHGMLRTGTAFDGSRFYKSQNCVAAA